MVYLVLGRSNAGDAIKISAAPDAFTILAKGIHPVTGLAEKDRQTERQEQSMIRNKQGTLRLCHKKKQTSAGAHPATYGGGIRGDDMAINMRRALNPQTRAE